MKRNKKLLILVGVLVLCIAAYAIVSAVAEKNEQKNTSSDTTSVTVTNFASSDVALLRWSFEGEDHSLSLTDSLWLNDADKNFPVKQSFATTMCTQIANITASRKLENVEDFAEYGLDEPVVSASIMTSTGGELSFVFGDTNAVSGECYMQFSEGGSFTANKDVYLVSAGIANAFSYAMDDLLQFESLPTMSDISSVKVEAAEEYRISYMGGDIGLPWVLRDKDGDKRAANTNLCEELTTALRNMSFIGCADYDSRSAELAKFGLDAPWATVTVEYSAAGTNADGSSSTTTEDLVFYLGNVDENGDYYVMLDDYIMLYTIDSEIADFIKANNIATITDLSGAI